MEKIISGSLSYEGVKCNTNHPYETSDHPFHNITEMKMYKAALPQVQGVTGSQVIITATPTGVSSEYFRELFMNSQKDNNDTTRV